MVTLPRAEWTLLNSSVAAFMPRSNQVLSTMVKIWLGAAPVLAAGAGAVPPVVAGAVVGAAAAGLVSAGFDSAGLAVGAGGAPQAARAASPAAAAEALMNERRSTIFASFLLA